MYFSGQSVSWDTGGVAYLDPDEEDSQLTYAHLYLITREQFCDIVMQENDLDIVPEIPFETVIRQKMFTFPHDKSYNHLIILGQVDGVPALTFTHNTRFETYNKPSIPYLKTIIRGLKTHFNLNNILILNYLLNKEGVSRHYEPEELERLMV